MSSADISILRNLPHGHRVLISFLSFFAGLCFFIVRDHGIGLALLAAVLVGIPAGFAFFAIYHIFMRR